MVMIKQNILVTHIAAASIYLAPTDLTYILLTDFYLFKMHFYVFPKEIDEVQMLSTGSFHYVLQGYHQ